MKRLLLAILALAITLPAAASLSGPELLQRLKQIQQSAAKFEDQFVLTCQYSFKNNDQWRIRLDFPTPDELKGLSQDELSRELTRACCEIRQIVNPPWDCGYAR